ncbi:MAG: 4a-hydroxytetrahydrobiopterin dehydratase [Glaciecola sp.]|nr:4a-hydroxytetrahydrobiopterin dehydratase [Glaciecola sp.]MDG1814839.1 4a-hydroxytetrahydrobiopterin dehydratase [Glaciecola sp.]MDG2100428.1 4a-hydroxytetrahydrobiopterin dehydratase [Glaciecola sp.]
MTEKLTSTQTQAALLELNTSLPENEQWTLQDGKLTKTFRFKSFIRAFGWMSQMAIWAEKMNHHPEWSNIYNIVDVKLVTHDVGGISELDIKLANKMEMFK